MLRETSVFTKLYPNHPQVKSHITGYVTLVKTFNAARIQMTLILISIAFRLRQCNKCDASRDMVPLV